MVFSLRISKSTFCCSNKYLIMVVKLSSRSSRKTTHPSTFKNLRSKVCSDLPRLVFTTLPKFNSSPLKSYRDPIGSRIVFQPPFFRGEVLNFGRVLQVESVFFFTNSNFQQPSDIGMDQYPSLTDCHGSWIGPPGENEIPGINPEGRAGVRPFGRGP